MRSLARPLIVALLLSAPAPATACLWDRDTLLMERRRFPGALELITGKFLRHSAAFYEWRVADRRRRLAEKPGDLALRDDLAVALDKLGRHDEAIAVARETEKLAPDRYETHANLGTFLIHAGRLEEGLKHIDRAIAINPDAHFGREVYQRHLVAYVLEKRRMAGGRVPLPLARSEGPFEALHGDFADYLRRQLPGPPETLPLEERRKALKGVLGMMRFGRHDSPVLLEAAAHLLSNNPFDVREDAKALAARAYLRAAAAVDDPAARKAYRALAEEVLRAQLERGKRVTLAAVEAQLAREVAAAEAWIARVHADERRWIEVSVDVDARFERKYLRGR